MINAISPETLKNWLDSNTVVLIDVREPLEYKAGYIRGAMLMPLAAVTASKLPDLQGKKLVIQCRSGGRSATACAKLMGENPDLSPINLTGGIFAWEKAGYPIAT